MSTSQPARKVRPLPPIPVNLPSGDIPNSIRAVQSPTTSHSNESQESLLTIASIPTINTILPSYSSHVVPSSPDIAMSSRMSEIYGITSPSTSNGSIDSPPRYLFNLPLSPVRTASDYANSTSIVTPSDEEFPSPSTPQQPSRSEFVQHRLPLMECDGKGFVTLRLVSRAPLSGTKSKQPSFIGGDIMKGALEVDCKDAVTIHGLVLNVKGLLFTVGNRESVILNHPHVLYSKRTHDPTTFSQCPISRNWKEDGKLHGNYHFPFAFPFPTEATTENSGTYGTPTVTWQLPPSFLERDSYVTVKYQLELLVERGKLKVNKKYAVLFLRNGCSVDQDAAYSIPINIIYTPLLVAAPASVKRQLAYQEGTLLPNPTSDPDGWHSLPNTNIRGTFRGHEAHISCTLWLANPLSYTRGTVLPCYLQLSGIDQECLEHLASPKSTFEIRLARYIYFYNPRCVPQYCAQLSLARDEQFKSVGIATWWKPPKPERPEEHGGRWLEGEIHLSKSLQPSCHHSQFSIEYFVEMMPLFSHAFRMIGDGIDQQIPVVGQSVKIACFHQHGPVPSAFTPNGRGRRGEARAYHPR
ncbi:hypothetical protein D9756_000156 [Leucocoprinus leucothites]|uniref:Arrestin-like N-terminal domain-containing protein n=1 Tax=Leucocoprinus leucothites TaxID=201217 RepID=A0A8H5GEL5_9AGAR|nr:hypothetical protein D9756_000156 [Leucoagaricus leucothites]